MRSCSTDGATGGGEGPANPAFDAAFASACARVALANVARPYPHKLDHLLVAGADATAADHIALHPVFSGSYDWHSSVHMHWLLVRILRLHPGVPERGRIVAWLDDRLTPALLARERAYCASSAGGTFERPYGWAWLLELRAELERLRQSDSRAVAWCAALDPLAVDLATRLEAFVRSAPYPIRTGAHANTAFAAILAIDYAHACDAPQLAAVLEDAARRWHGDDRDAPLHWEPSLTDFLSPSLAVAAFVRAVLPPASFPARLSALLPHGIGPLADPPRVSDRADAQIAHLDGLALSRAWMLRRIGAGLPADDPRRDDLAAASARNLAAGLPHVLGGNYVGEHWLASFAALALGDVP
ncbi:MAG: DUF2891 domain-containing protein [Planctomycetota bacterium]|nr:MAG: DUF2891 domain-containing protein [Planctomycetota bacterium]